MKTALAQFAAVCALSFLVGWKNSQLHRQQALLKKTIELLEVCSKQRDFFEAYPTNKNFQLASASMRALEHCGGSNICLMVVVQLDGVMFMGTAQSNGLALRPFEIERRLVREPLDQL